MRITERFNQRLSIGFLLLIGLAVRLPLLLSGLPYVTHPDEPVNLAILQGLLLRHSADPGWFHYPSMFFYLALPSEWAVSLLEHGLKPIAIQATGDGFAPQIWDLVAPRLTELALSVMTIPLAYGVARMLGVGIIGAFAAAGLIAITPLSLTNSALFTPDTGAAAFVMLLYCSVTWADLKPGLRYDLIPALLAGLAAGAKWHAGVFGVVVLFRLWGPQQRGHHRAVRLSVMALAAIAGLLCSTPMLAIEPLVVFRDIGFEMQHYHEGHPGAESGSLAANATTLWANFGPTLCLALLPFFGPARRRFIPLLTGIILLFTLTSVETVHFDRNLLPAIPPLAVLIGAGAEQVLRSAAYPRHAGGFLIAALLAFPAWSSGRALAAFDPDPTLAARAWINRAVPDDARVLIEPYSPFIETRRRTIDKPPFLTLRMSDMNQLTTYDAVLLTRRGSGRFMSPAYPQEHARLKTLRKLACGEDAYPRPPARPSYLLLRFRCPSGAVPPSRPFVATGKSAP